ncbi:Uncharacterized membrane protein YebE, DUF533 family [Cognatiyoonia koreensis]|uniref:Uncharacterized membrane protein YebE, DUF533 family n=1 Tax=Cognatiyoonia koreensis TaxID=364200 RepID=A0A1I0N5G3_9RHOB|nr:DUF533 domain-containing protein [Cognatiyoonia koreensis]SEV96357.1 Uncharacterized membrane protein YebE, DUF533 family [Cognatiyoonia koreensis]
MSLMNTVTKLAIGFAMAKGMDAVQERGGIGKVMQGLTGGGSGGQGGGIGDMLGSLGGGKGGLLGQLTGGSGGGAGSLAGLGGLLGGLGAARGGNAGGLESLINQDNPAQEPDEDEVAQLMLRAMTQAARADGDIDAGEKEQLMAVIRQSDPENVAVVQQMLQDPVDPAALASDTPQGLETQVYTMAVNSITPDNQAEAQYLHALAQGLNIQPQTANEIHDNLGAPRLYT